MSLLRLPPLDRIASWRTGYTRDHWIAVADHLLDAVQPYATEGFAQFRLPGRHSWSGVGLDGLEGFARTFLLLAFRVAGEDGAARPDLVERYAQGLASGTDPGHRHAWPVLTDNSQQIVEAASIALALHETRPWIYDRLDPAVRERIVDWLAGIIGTRTWPCNWVLFKVIIQQFLAGVGGPYDPAEIKEALAEVEGWYVGDGWYTDGDGQNYDYYAGWAMHLYTLWWARMAGEDATVYRERLRLFLGDYRHFFGGDGAPVHQGRSLTYRFAAAAPLWAGEIFGATPLAPGVTRRLASAALRYFVERGAPDGRGLLPLGWHGAYLPVTQPYSGPASPYWASKAFIGLLLPSDHPAWTEPEGAVPLDERDQVTALPAPGWLLHATRHDGIVRLVNHGSDHNAPPPAAASDDPHYAKFAYSTHTAPETGDDGWTRVVDGHLAVLAPDGSATRRRRIERIGVFDRFAASRYADGPVTVDTASIVRGPVELRIHRVTAPAGHTVRDGGHAIAAEVPPEEEIIGRQTPAEVAVGPAGAEPSGGPVAGSGVRPVAGAVVRAVVRAPGGLTGSISGLAGWSAAGVARTLAGNACGPCSATPYLLAPGHPGGTTVHVSMVVLGGDGREPPADTLDLRVDGDAESPEVSVRFPDGELVAVRLGERPRYLRQAPGQAPLVWTG